MKGGLYRQVGVLAMMVALCAVAARDWRSPEERLEVCRSNVRVLASALEKHDQLHDTVPQSLSELVPDYLEALPRCPNARADSYAIEVSAGAGRFPSIVSVQCDGAQHSGTGQTPDRPREQVIYSYDRYYYLHYDGETNFEISNAPSNRGIQGLIERAP